MEAIAAAASIAGIITLAAQAIDGLQKLHGFFNDVSAGSKAISRLLSEINALITVLQNIDHVLYQVESQRSKNQNFASLDIKLEDCTKDVGSWLQLAKELKPGEGKGGRAWVRRARLAAKGEVVGRIRDEIGRHRQALCLSLAVFGRFVLASLRFIALSCILRQTFNPSFEMLVAGLREVDGKHRILDVDTSDQIYQMRGRFDNALTTSLSNHGAHGEVLERIERYSMTSMQSSAHSIKSMDSIRTELSRLEAMITSTQTSASVRAELPQEQPVAGPSRSARTPLLPEASGQDNMPEQLVSPLATGFRDASPASGPRSGSSSASNYNSSASSVIHGGARMRFRARTRPADFHDLVKEQENISKRFSENSTDHESALLYAQFSRPDPPATKGDHAPSFVNDDADSGKVVQDEDPHIRKHVSMKHSGPPREVSGISRNPVSFGDDLRSRFAQTSVSRRVEDRADESHHSIHKAKNVPSKSDHRSTYDLLEEASAAMYPPSIAEYLSLQNLTMLCEIHLAVAEKHSKLGSKNKVRIDSSHAEDTDFHLRRLRDRLEMLHDSVDSLSRACIKAGYSVTELEETIVSVARRGAGGCRASPPPEETSHHQEQSESIDHISDDSDAYFSMNE